MGDFEADYSTVGQVARSAYRLKETGDDYGPLLDALGDASIVLLGESTHGTHEFYRERAQITKQLIHMKGFKAVAIEGDWPDANRICRFVTGTGSDVEASEALSGFDRFPSWMWANADTLDFIGWLRFYNDKLQASTRPVGFYGLDIYSLYRSAHEVIVYLSSIDPNAADRARSRFACFERFEGDSQKYAYATGLGIAKSCEDEVIAQLCELLQNASQYRTHGDEGSASDDYFNAEQNARLVQSAEHYYRTMLREDISSWNLRDLHMAETVEHIREHLVRHGDQPKIVVWAHNSHLGDCRATEMSRRGELNVGQLLKESYPTEVMSVGFTTYTGKVTAASKWDGQAEIKVIRPALPGSYENLFHSIGIPRFFLDLKNNAQVAQLLRQPMLERAIGVIYKPETERLSHYFEATLSDQFDAIIHIDRTRPVEPLERRSRWESGAEAPETYPTGV